MVDITGYLCHAVPSPPELISTIGAQNRAALTKAHLIETVQTEIGFTRHQATEIVENLIELIKSTLESGEDVLISGFGKFCVNEKAERRGRNPATGEDLMLAPRRVVTFKCSGKLRDRIN